jgi:VanZ family protein
MAVIFAFSHHPNIETGSSHDFALKKTAHLFEYGILALTLYFARTGRLGTWSFPAARSAWILSVLYAFTDEIHQSFIPTRSARLRDVLIDAAGTLLALAVLRIAIPRSRPK